MDKVVSSAAAAVADVPDGATIVMPMSKPWLNEMSKEDAGN